MSVKNKITFRSILYTPLLKEQEKAYRNIQAESNYRTILFFSFLLICTSILLSFQHIYLPDEEPGSLLQFIYLGLHLLSMVFGVTYSLLLRRKEVVEDPAKYFMLYRVFILYVVTWASILTALDLQTTLDYSAIIVVMFIVSYLHRDTTYFFQILYTIVIIVIEIAMYFSTHSSYGSQISFFLYSLLALISAFVQESGKRQNFKLKAELEEKNIQLKRQSFFNTDTGLYNLIYAKETLKMYIKLQERYNSQICLILIQYEGLISESSYKELARKLIILLRTSDTIVSYSNDQYLIILPNTDMQLARTAALRILDQLQNDFQFSMGITSIKAKDDVEGLLKRSEEIQNSARLSQEPKIADEGILEINTKKRKSS
jgi:GGDEF domain-containing protein